ncbi:uncharacterized protein LOC110988191 isoform X2 [Acanthaster planci]|uniref:Uncharacterized protein LOC110988191 isoform X2 n=1 Tax=Acanthaster planci TaxID=133434 RepID=A0A8B7ZQN4_ACAPL|nr:uncharacterized protein LOC110988191 isoform X2 [Acanthaster planci]
MEGYTTLILLICLGCVCAYDFNKLSGEERRLALRNEIYKLVDDHENRRGKAPAPQELERGTDQHGEDRDLTLRELMYKVLDKLESPTQKRGVYCNGHYCSGEDEVCRTRPGGGQYCSRD